MISQFLVYMQSGLGFLFSRPYLLSGLTLFGEDQEIKGEYILYPLSYSYPQTCPSFSPLHYHANSTANVLNLLVLFCHSHYPQIADI